MAKISANYEVLFIIDPAQGEEGVAALTEKFKTLVEQNSSAMEVEEWGKRKLAYAINYITEGYYVLINFTSAPDFPKELDRILRLTDGILRSMIVCKDE
jgi:small subunit ribosomal protein S6